MGEIAEMMLDGTMCEGCGEFIDGESPGYPRYCCDQCAADRGVTMPKKRRRRRKRRRQSQPPAQGRPATAGAGALQSNPAPAGKDVP